MCKIGLPAVYPWYARGTDAGDCSASLSRVKRGGTAAYHGYNKAAEPGCRNHNRSVLTRGTHANARDNNAVQTRNKRAMTVLHPRLPAKISRPTACNHVLTAAVARPSTFVPRLYRVFTACVPRVPRVPPAITRGLNFWAAQNFFARPTACEFLTACNDG